MVIAVEKNKKGRIELTKEELEKILSDEREAGYYNGYKAGFEICKDSTLTFLNKLEEKINDSSNRKE